MFVKVLRFDDMLAIKKESDERIIAAKIMHKDRTSPGEVYLRPSKCSSL